MQANCKHIKALEKFTGHCEPVFAFYQVNSQPNVDLQCWSAVCCSQQPKVLLQQYSMKERHPCNMQDGKLLNTITGVNAPVISTTVDKLSAEAAAVATAKA